MKANKLLNWTFFNENLLFIIFSRNQQTKIDLVFVSDYNDTRAFKIFKCTVSCVFKCETTKMKLAKNTQKSGFLSKNVFGNIIFYQILVLFKFFENFLCSTLSSLMSKSWGKSSVGLQDSFSPI